MKVRFYSTLRDLTGKKEVEISVARTVRELLEKLDEIFPEI